MMLAVDLFVVTLPQIKEISIYFKFLRLFIINGTLFSQLLKCYMIFLLYLLM